MAATGATGTDTANSAGGRTCVLLLGGSFDPVHSGHVALAEHFLNLVKPDSVRLVPAGSPWQKGSLQASAEDRVAMLRLAFNGLRRADHKPVALTIDEQELHRPPGSFTIDTLRDLRQQFGPDASLVWALGADQLARFHTWQDWRALFGLANFCAASRPGFSLQSADLPPEVAHEFSQRLATPEQVRNCSHGRTLITHELAVDVSSTALRSALAAGAPLGSALPPGVLDYALQHHLYRS